MISSKQIATLLLLFVTAFSDAFGAEDKPAPKSIPELQIAIENVLKETKTPGAAVAIVSRDKVEWVAGIGMADVAARKPVTAETLFRIGSVSKAFAVLAALQLQEEGKLKLTDTVHQWVPEVAFSNPWEATDPVRLVHLMEHTTGCRNRIGLRPDGKLSGPPAGLGFAKAVRQTARLHSDDNTSAALPQCGLAGVV